MLAAVRSAGLRGIEAFDITVEVDASNGLPQWTIVGLPIGAVKESRDRVGAAIFNSGLTLPPRRITVNLAPADVRKEGTAFDLPIALGIIVATGQLPPDRLNGRIFLAELGLDGQLRPVRGTLPIARHAANGGGPAELVVPRENVAEARLVGSLRVAAPADLKTLVRELRAGQLTPAPDESPPVLATGDTPDFGEVVGQECAKRSLEVAAAGGHNVVMCGPPGAGKTMLARRLAGILPPLTQSEALEVIAVHSVAGALQHVSANPERPFRAPHHSISAAGLIGGGSNPRPGEVSLAHNGVLFLDELYEFPRSVLDGLRQPMEDGRVTIRRATMAVSYPARFTLVGACNPCPCGRLGDATGTCTCSGADVERYTSRMSGPLADRIDMQVTVSAVALRELSAVRTVESSKQIRERVMRARARQSRRYASLPGILCNAHASGRWIDSYGAVTTPARSLLHTAAERLGLSARAYHRTLRVSRTIADLDDCESVAVSHVAEALRYRRT